MSEPHHVSCWLSWVVVAALSGCTFGAKDAAAPLVRVEAERDLQCPEDRIHVESEWGGKYTAIGCGRKARYDSVCHHLQCQVVREGEAPPGWRDRPEPGDPRLGR